MTVQLLQLRFEELLKQFDEVTATKTPSGFAGTYNVDEPKLLNWRVKARSLIVAACGKDSEHLKDFKSAEEPQSYQSSLERAELLSAVFQAAKEDYAGGYLNSVRNLVQAEVFSTELEQASELLASGYRLPAAVVAGVVLETKLRQLCSDSGISAGKLDRMNADLAKSALYNSIVQKRITAVAGVRNSAAHGRPDEFSDADVKDMIDFIERFLMEHL